MRTVQNVIDSIAPRRYEQLRTPTYTPDFAIKPDKGICLAVSSMKHHMTDEGWQIMLALESAGYDLYGYGIENTPELRRNNTQVGQILMDARPGIVVVQDKREWDVLPTDFRDPNARFHGVNRLADFREIFKLTILKDAHQRPAYHEQSAREIDCHAWIIYYHPRIVVHLAPYVRPQHLVRTYHSLDASLVPPFDTQNRDGCLLSGAISGAYPLRTHLVRNVGKLAKTDYLPHPGYGRSGCCTPGFLQRLSHYKVAICTSSIYGYALRKIIEATACGCIVITDLPKDEELPEIDANLARVPVDITIEMMSGLITKLCESYDAELQNYFAEKAKTYYNYIAIGQRLAKDIETLRANYTCQ